MKGLLISGGLFFIISFILISLSDYKKHKSLDLGYTTLISVFASLLFILFSVIIDPNKLTIEEEPMVVVTDEKTVLGEYITLEEAEQNN